MCCRDSTPGPVTKLLAIHPNQHVLPNERDSLGEEIAKWHKHIDRKNAPKEDRCNREQNWLARTEQPSQAHLQPDQQKYKRVNDEGGVFPERSQCRESSCAHRC